MSVEKLPPQNIEAEQSVLGSLLIDRDAVSKVASFLRPEDFYREAHGQIYAAILSLYERREPVDFITLCDELDRREQLEAVGDASYITGLINAVPTAAHVEHYGHIVERAALRRRLIQAAGRIAEVAYEETEDVDEVIDRAEQLVFGVAQRRLARELIPISKLLYDYFDEIEYLQQHRDERRGVLSGFADLDKLLGGLQPSDLVIVAGRPGMGKSSLILTIANNVAAQNRGAIAVFSLEMAAEQLAQRLIASETGIDAQRLRLGQIHDDEIELVTRAIGHLSQMSMYIDDSPAISPLELRTKARRLHSEHPLALIIVDYLQLMVAGVRVENRVQEISYISRSLKSLARELSVPVIAASQLSRAVESRQEKRPILADLRESGCLAGDTLIMRADTGQLVPIKQLAQEEASIPVLTVGEDLKLLVATMTRAFPSGHKLIYLLRTRSGRRIKASANHPFRKLSGWVRLDGLRPGDRVAVPRVLPGMPQKPVSMDDAQLQTLANSDLYWDEVVSIEELGVEEVYDATVPSTHNFIANDIVVHNSIEQDSDVVMFIYRDEMYNEDTVMKNIAEVHVAKHRNGPTGKIELGFIPQQVKFVNLYREPA